MSRRLIKDDTNTSNILSSNTNIISSNTQNTFQSTTNLSDVVRAYKGYFMQGITGGNVSIDTNSISVNNPTETGSQLNITAPQIKLSGNIILDSDYEGSTLDINSSRLRVSDTIIYFSKITSSNDIGHVFQYYDNVKSNFEIGFIGFNPKDKKFRVYNSTNKNLEAIENSSVYFTRDNNLDSTGIFNPIIYQDTRDNLGDIQCRTIEAYQGIITDKLKLSSLTVNDNFVIDITGSITSLGNINISNGLFFINSLTGDTNIAGRLDIRSNLNINEKFKVNALTGYTVINGNAKISGSLEINQDLNLNNKFIVNANEGNVDIFNNLYINKDKFIVYGQTGNLSINNEKFTVNGLTGDTYIDGKLELKKDFNITEGNVNISKNLIINKDKLIFNGDTGNLSLNNGVFTVNGSTGDTYINGTLNLNQDLNLNNKFIVNAIQGDVEIGNDLIINKDKLIFYGSTAYLTINKGKYTIDGANGNTFIGGNLNLNNKLLINAISGNLQINNNKFFIEGLTGTLKINDLFTIDGSTGSINANNKFILDATQGNLDLLNSLRINTNKFVIDNTGTLKINNLFTIDGSTGSINANNKFILDTTQGNLDLLNSLRINTNKFVIDNTGTVRINDLFIIDGLSGSINANNKFILDASEGNLDLLNSLRINTNKFVIDNTGTVRINDLFTIYGTTGSINANNKFILDATQGNLHLLNNLCINTNKLVVEGQTGTLRINDLFTIDGSSGSINANNKLIFNGNTGDLELLNNFRINTNKFIVENTGKVSINDNQLIISELGNLLTKDDFYINEKFIIKKTGQVIILDDVNINDKILIDANIGDVNIFNNVYARNLLLGNNVVINGDTGDLIINDGKFKIDGNTGNTFIDGSLNINNGKLIIDKYGNLSTQGQLNFSDKLSINENGTLELASNLLVGDNTLFVDSSIKHVGIGTNDLPYALNVVGDINITGYYKVNGEDLIDSIPVGTVMPYVSEYVPTGWLPCDGRELLRETYRDLYDIIGNKYGNGDGLTTFNIPDMRGRDIIGSGKGLDLTSRVLGEKGGEEKHMMTEDEIASHSHRTYNTISDMGGEYSYERNTVNMLTGDRGGDYQMLNTENKNFIEHTGENKPFNVMQPYIVCNYIIKVESILSMFGRPFNFWKKNHGQIYYEEGMVGIGTSNPQSTLEVRGDITQTGENVTTQLKSTIIDGCIRMSIIDLDISNNIINLDLTKSSNFNLTLDISSSLIFQIYLTEELIGQKGEICIIENSSNRQITFDNKMKFKIGTKPQYLPNGSMSDPIICRIKYTIINLFIILCEYEIFE